MTSAKVQPAADGVPVIDIRSLEEPRALCAVDAACRAWGFFQVTGHGIDDAVFTDLFDAAHRFFAQPVATKRLIARTAENPWGYYDQELTKNTRDWKQIYDYGPPDGRTLVPQWPHGLPRFERAVRDYYAACRKVAERLLAAIARNLGASPAVLARGFDDGHTSFVRLNYYPACPAPAAPTDMSTPVEGFLGVNHHTDAGALTLLLQDNQPGLEVFRGGRWHSVEPRSDALVVNLGDVVQVWSNDRYPAPVHRAVTSAEKARYSAPFFYNPSYDTDYAPLPSTVDAAHPPRYRTINWGEFRALRTAGDYADYGEEVQIAHYALRGD
jgi:isopenicillin N synthase-like dioxygenase